MGTSRDTSKRGRAGKRPRHSPPPRSLDDGASSSSYALHLQNAQLSGGALTKDPGKDDVVVDAFRDSEETPAQPGASTRLPAEGRPPPGAILEAQGRPPPGATLEAQGRPPPETQGRPPRAEGEENFFLDILPPDPGRFEIMQWILNDDPPALTLPPKAMFVALEKCLQGHRELPGEGDAAQGYGVEMFETPSRLSGRYG